ncbi:TraB/GumN family protein [Uliginosibacterium sp. TH139]|uniref:TraB/GumN family protein n=1 Tax=Uliginosibacterium sp. TH139 TaxID=2067453 RepID=UPI00352BFD55
MTCSRDPLCIEKYADLGVSASRCKTIDCLRDTYDFSRRSGLYEAFALPARNSNMLEAILSYIPSGNVLVLVGALHMLGPQGLISLLHGEGFKDSECGFN